MMYNRSPEEESFLQGSQYSAKVMQIIMHRPVLVHLLDKQW